VLVNVMRFGMLIVSTLPKIHLVRVWPSADRVNSFITRPALASAQLGY